MAKPLKLILVEDNPIDAELLLRELSHAGYEPDCAVVQTEPDFLARLNDQVDLVISDYRLPQFGGLLALELLNKSGLGIPFILVSGTIGEDIAVNAIKQGAADYLLKDRLGRLSTAVAQAIDAVRLQREKRRADTKYQHIFEHAVEGIYQSTVAGRFVTVNPALAHMAGFASSQEMIDGITDIGAQLYVDPAQRREMERHLREQGHISNFEIQIRRRDGKVIWISTNARRTPSVAGEPDYFEGTVVDITARKHSEAALRYQEALLRETGRIARIGGWELEVATGKGTWTEEVAKIHELDPALPPSKDFGFSFYAEESRARIEQAVKAAIESQTPYDLELKLTTAKGNRRWVRSIGRPVLEKGRVTRLRGSCQDITERKQAEATLRESEERFRQIAENINEVFWMTDVEKSQMLYVSPAYEKIWGRSPERIYQSPSNWQDAIHPDDLETVSRPVRTKQVRTGYDETYRILRPDGSTRWIRDRTYPIKDKTGRVYRVIGTAEDVTEQRQLEAQFRQAQKMEAIGTLAGGIAHDFNNILGGIMGYGELAGLHLTDNDPAKEYLNYLMTGAHRAAALVRQILGFSREQEQTRQLLQLRHVVAEPLNLLRATLPATIELQSSYSEALPAVLADATQVHQMVLNLCTNAAHAMRGRPGRLEVLLDKLEVDETLARKVPNLKTGPYVRLSVSDTGIGMDAATIERIFEPFFTTKPAGEGTGLGLAATHNIMRVHEGAIQVESEPNHGTTFRLYFPAQAAAAELPVSTPAEIPRGAGQQILLVDDEESLSLLVCAMLEELGYVVTSTYSPRAVLEAVRMNPRKYDMVITDLTMPDLTGVDLIRELHKIRPDLPTLLSSGDSIRLNALKANPVEGINEMILKPLTLSSLGNAVSRILANARSGIVSRL